MIPLVYWILYYFHLVYYLRTLWETASNTLLKSKYILATALPPTHRAHHLIGKNQISRTRLALDESTLAIPSYLVLLQMLQKVLEDLLHDLPSIEEDWSVIPQDLLVCNTSFFPFLKKDSIFAPFSIIQDLPQPTSKKFSKRISNGYKLPQPVPSVL